MDTNGSPQPPVVEATFADAAQAERAVAELQQHGVEPQRIDVQHRQGVAPGLTADRDEQIAHRLFSSWAAGAATGGAIGVVLGAVIAGFSVGWFTPVFWGVVVGLGVALAAVGLLWGMFARFGMRGGPPPYDADQPVEVRDAVHVVVRAEPDEREDVRRILLDKGGAAPAR